MTMQSPESEMPVRRLRVDRRSGINMAGMDARAKCSLCGYPLDIHDQKLVDLYGRARACVAVLLRRIETLEDENAELMQEQIMDLSGWPGR